MFHPSYNIQETDKMFDQCLVCKYNKITIASLFHIAESFGISFRSGLIKGTPAGNIYIVSPQSHVRNSTSAGTPQESISQYHKTDGLSDETISKEAHLFVQQEPKGKKGSKKRGYSKNPKFQGCGSCTWFINDFEVID
jgi:hypothetical protein